jgi:hypothetical protein
MNQIDKKYYLLVNRLATSVAYKVGNISYQEDLANEFCADLLDGRFDEKQPGNGLIKRIMLTYFDRWTRIRVSVDRIREYLRYASRIPCPPSDFFELKEIWEIASEAQKTSLFILLTEGNFISAGTTKINGKRYINNMYKLRKKIRKLNEYNSHSSSER